MAMMTIMTMTIRRVRAWRPLSFQYSFHSIQQDDGDDYDGDNDDNGNSDDGVGDDDSDDDGEFNIPIIKSNSCFPAAHCQSTLGP